MLSLQLSEETDIVDTEQTDNSMARLIIIISEHTYNTYAISGQIISDLYTYRSDTNMSS